MEAIDKLQSQAGRRYSLDARQSNKIYRRGRQDEYGIY